MADLSGQLIGPYRILEPLGQGGMAEVYRADDTHLDRIVAFKIIRRGLFGPEVLERLAARFDREARALAQLTHPHIVRIYDYGTHENTPYLVMELLEGGTLKTRTGVPRPWQDVVRILAPVADALAHAHAHGILHRDVKPSNLIVSPDGRLMLADFGIAKLLEQSGEETLTGTGVGVGTPEYMAPEQGLGQAVDGRADVYSLGVVLYELLTGKKPFQADTPLAVLQKQMHDPLPAPRSLVPDLPESMDRVVRKALIKRPEDRFADMAVFAGVLHRLAQGETVPVILSETDRPVSRFTPRAESDLEAAEHETMDFLESPPKEQASAQAARRRPGRRLGRWVITGLLAILLIAGGALLLPFLQAQREQAIIASLIAFETEQVRITGTAEAQVRSAWTDTPTQTASPMATSTSTATITLTPTPEPASGATRVREVDGMVEVYVPAGPFRMGSTEEEIEEAMVVCSSYSGYECSRDIFSSEKPQHEVHLEGFWIDRTEVTNAMYARCVAEGSCSPPLDDSAYIEEDYYPNPDYADYPVIWMSWPQADAYCIWAGGRLPTEAEWEKAARGTDRRLYPWGNDPPTQYLLNFNWFHLDPMPVGSYPDGASPYGALDMAGNASEWVADSWVWYPGSELGWGMEGDPESAPIRGGSWYQSADEYMTSVRSASRWSNLKREAWIDQGFRCARSH